MKTLKYIKKLGLSKYIAICLAVIMAIGVIDFSAIVFAIEYGGYEQGIGDAYPPYDAYPYEPPYNEGGYYDVDDNYQDYTPDAGTSIQDIPQDQPPNIFAPIPQNNDDLNSFITDVIVRDGNTVLTPDPDRITIVGGQILQFTLEFASVPSGTDMRHFPSGADGNLNYMLPSQLVPQGTLENVAIRNHLDTIIGEFNMIAGLISVVFFDVDSHGNATPGVNYTTHYVDISFTINFEAEVVYLPGEAEFDIGTVGFTVVPPFIDLNVEKSARWRLHDFNVALGELTGERFEFTIDIINDGFVPVTGLSITDTLSFPVPWGAAGNPTGANPAFNMRLDNPVANTAVSNASFYVNGEVGNRVEFTFAHNAQGNVLTHTFVDANGDPVTLNRGDTITVMYYVCVNTIIANNTHLHTNYARAFDHNQANQPIGFNTGSHNFTLGNHAEVNFQNQSATTSFTGNTRVRAQRTLTAFMQKSVDPAGGNSAATFRTWAAIMGNGSFAINGYTMHDMLDSRFDHPVGRIQLPTNLAAFSVRFYSKPTGIGGNNHVQGILNMDLPNANYVATFNGPAISNTTAVERDRIFMMPANDPRIAHLFTRISDHEFTFRVPVDGVDGSWPDIYRVVIRYSTTHTPPSGEHADERFYNHVFFQAPPANATTEQVSGFSGRGANFASIWFTHAGLRAVEMIHHSGAVGPLRNERSVTETGEQSIQWCNVTNQFVIQYVHRITMPGTNESGADGHRDPSRARWVENYLFYVPGGTGRNQSTPYNAIPIYNNPPNVDVVLTAHTIGQNALVPNNNIGVNIPNFRWNIVRTPGSDHHWEFYFTFNSDPNFRPTSREQSVWNPSGNVARDYVITITYTVPLNSFRTLDSAVPNVAELLQDPATGNGAQIRSESRIRVQQISGGQLTGEITSPSNADFHQARRADDYWPIFREVRQDTFDPTIFHHRVMINHRPGDSRLNLMGSDASNVPRLFSDSFPGMTLVPNSVHVERLIGETDASAPNMVQYFGPYNATGQAVRNAPFSSAVTGGVNGFTLDLRQLNTINWGGGSARFNPRSILATVGTPSPGMLDIQIPTTNLQIQMDTHTTPRVVIYYSTQVTSLSGLTSGQTFWHDATIHSATRGDFSVDVEVMYETQVISKQMESTDGTNRLAAEVIINRHGELLSSRDDPTHTPDFFIARDTMSENLTLEYSSLRVYAMVNGHWVLRPRGEEGEPWSVNIINSRSFEVILPNETPVRMMYNVLYTGGVGGAGSNISNEVYLVGIADLEIEHIGFAANSFATAGSNSGRFLLNKMNYEVPTQRLVGATFDLYVATFPSFSNLVGVPDLNNYREINGNRFFRQTDIPTATSDANGQIEFSGAIVLPNDRLVFLLVETSAPDGFETPVGQDAYTVFVFGFAQMGPEVEALEQLLGVPVRVIAESIDIYNHPAQDAIELEIRKAVTGQTTDREFMFTATFTNPVSFGGEPAQYEHRFGLAHNQTRRFTNIPHGTSVTIVEDDYSYYRFESNFADNTTTITNMTSRAVRYVAQFTNTYRPLNQPPTPTTPTQPPIEDDPPTYMPNHPPTQTTPITTTPQPEQTTEPNTNPETPAVSDSTHQLVLREDTWVEVNEDGEEVGIWTWDEEVEIWIFYGEPEIATAEPTAVYEASMPQTGVVRNALTFAYAFGASLAIATVSAVMIIICRRKKARNN